MATKRMTQRLIRRYEVARAKRHYREQIEEPIKDQIKAILESPKYSIIDFWCNVCKKDCKGTGYKQVRHLPNRIPHSWYMGVCPLGHKLVRRITDKYADSYYYASLMMQHQRLEYADLLLTPEDPRFKEVYPEQYRQLVKNGGKRAKS
jgi:hypothetical protein